MNTYIIFKTAPGGSKTFNECDKLITQIESKMSRTLPDSDVYNFNKSSEGTTVTDETAFVLKTALTVASETGNTFNPALGSLTSLWNITDNPHIPSEDEISLLVSSANYNNIIIEQNHIAKTDPLTNIDLGAIAKGYACSVVVDYMRTAGVKYGMVSFGGNIGVFGVKPDGGKWIIAIKKPPISSEDEAGVIGYLHIDSGFVSVSGDYERYFEQDGIKYHHILDPKTGYPASSGFRSVAVWADDGMIADALSTALFVMGTDKAMDFYKSSTFKFEAIFITDNDVTITPGLTEIYEPAT